MRGGPPERAGPLQGAEVWLAVAVEHAGAGPTPHGRVWHHWQALDVLRGAASPRPWAGRRQGSLSTCTQAGAHTFRGVNMQPSGTTALWAGTRELGKAFQLNLSPSRASLAA